MPIGDTNGRTPRATKRSPGEAWWIISRVENGRVRVLTVSHSGQKVLPVFSYREEAELFLRFGGSGEGWHVRESRRGELLPVLCGPCAGVGRVALDPLPEPLTGPMFDLFCLSRRKFVRDLTEGPGNAMGPSSPPDDRRRGASRTPTGQGVPRGEPER